MGDAAGLPGQRIDRWLWQARFLKSRSLASGFVETGRLRVNGERIAKASRQVRPGDILTFPLGPHIRVVKIVALPVRRGPAPEARALYEDLDPPAETVKPDEKTPADREPGTGRPTKKDRRAIDALKNEG